MSALAHPPMTDTSDLVARFRPIELDEVLAEAAMLTRVDRKYVLDTAALLRVLTALDAASGNVRVLQIDGRRDFGYRSTYLDTPDLRSFHSTGQGRRRRFKVRTRRYLDTGTSYLEVKTRGARGTTVKTRIEHPELAYGLTGPGRQFVQQVLTDAAVPGVGVTDLTPTLVSQYRRTTLYVAGENGASRATIDTALTWRTVGRLTGARIAADDLVIVETKAAATPSAVDRVLWSLGHRPATISKYGTGMAALLPALPELKWHRTIHRDLSGGLRPRYVATTTGPSDGPTIGVRR